MESSRSIVGVLALSLVDRGNSFANDWLQHCIEDLEWCERALRYAIEGKGNSIKIETPDLEEWRFIDHLLSHEDEILR